MSDTDLDNMRRAMANLRLVAINGGAMKANGNYDRMVLQPFLSGTEIPQAEEGDRLELVNYVAGSLRVAARERSKGGTTGISEERAHDYALEIVDRMLREKPDLLLRQVAHHETWR